MAFRRPVRRPVRFPAVAPLLLFLTGFAAAGAARAEQGTTTFSEIEQAAQRNALCSASNAPGVGLQADYFAAEGLAGALLQSRTDAPVAFDPASARAPVPRSARWTGWIKAPFSGDYLLHAGTPAARITVARQAAVAPGGKPLPLHMDAGRFYPISIEVDRLADAPVRLEWTSPNGARYVVPRGFLYLPTVSSGAAR